MKVIQNHKNKVWKIPNFFRPRYSHFPSHFPYNTIKTDLRDSPWTTISRLKSRTSRGAGAGVSETTTKKHKFPSKLRESILPSSTSWGSDERRGKPVRSVFIYSSFFFFFSFGIVEIVTTKAGGLRANELGTTHLFRHSKCRAGGTRPNAGRARIRGTRVDLPSLKNTPPCPPPPSPGQSNNRERPCRQTSVLLIISSGWYLENH